MKKIILSMALVAGMTFVACSSDDDSGSNDGCVTCAAYEFSGVTMPAQDVCKGENGNAVVDGEDTEVSYDTYVSALQNFTTCN